MCKQYLKIAVFLDMTPCGYGERFLQYVMTYGTTQCYKLNIYYCENLSSHIVFLLLLLV
jgi:hypothetical protein